MNLAAKYRPSCFEDVTEQGAVVDILKKICSDSELPNRNFLFIGPAGTGKAQPLYSKVLTPKGFIQMKDVKVGTEVIDGEGAVTAVTGVYPQGRRKCYDIKFDDNSYIRVADNHLNSVTEVKIDTEMVESKIMTTLELLDSMNKGEAWYFVPLRGRSTEFVECSNFIHPYLLGVFAAYGEIVNGDIVFSCLPPTAIMNLNSILTNDWFCKIAFLGRDGGNKSHKFKVVPLENSDPANVQFLIREFRAYMPELFEIPRRLPEYCIGCSESYREFVLDGLSANFSSDYNTFETDNKILSDQFTEIANSLGQVDYVDESDYFPEITLYIHRTLPAMQSARRIVSVEEVGDVECQCIMVESDAHTYVTDNYTVTHNTTLGRIISKQLNGGSNSGVIEIDAASHSGADAARDITNQARAYPVGTAWKCFIIDECHAISSQGWQVLLKTLEESPAKSIFILCTTNPEKIPATILSRVQTFRLSKISVDGIASRLKYICDAEIKDGAKINYDDKALTYIAKLGNGGMRDSIQLLDRALAYSKDVNIKNLAVALDLPNYDTYFALLNGIAKKDNEEIVRIINDVYDSGTNFVRWFEGFHSFVCQIIKYIFLKNISKTMIPEYYQDKISGYGANHAMLCLKLANTLLKLNHELKTTNYLQEVAITFLCAPVKKVQND